jgi:hypothetical protein
MQSNKKLNSMVKINTYCKKISARPIVKSMFEYKIISEEQQKSAFINGIILLFSVATNAVTITSKATEGLSEPVRLGSEKLLQVSMT